MAFSYRLARRRSSRAPLHVRRQKGQMCAELSGGDMDNVVTPASHAAALWAGLLVLLLLVLAVLVVRQRQRHGVLIGDGGVEEVLRATRVFGNAAEYIPAGLAALAILALAGARPLVVHGVGLLLLLGRLAHAWGLSTNTGLSLGRTAGMVLTWLALLIAGALLLFYSLP